MRPHVPNERLGPDLVPDADAPWRELVEFGHRFHAYRVAGSLQRVARLTVETHERWQRTGELPDDLTRLRLCLFHTVRAVGLEGDPDEETEAWARALVGAIVGAVRGRSGPDHR